MKPRRRYQTCPACDIAFDASRPIPVHRWLVGPCPGGLPDGAHVVSPEGRLGEVRRGWVYHYNGSPWPDCTHIARVLEREYPPDPDAMPE